MVKRYRNRRMKKRGGRRPRRVQRTTLVNRALAPIASRFITKMKYSQTFSVSGTLTTPYQFNLNSIFDPDRTGTGTQPYGHDQLEVLYNRYRVISTSYVISGYNPNNPIRLCVFPSNNTSIVGSLSEACMIPRAKFIHQNPAAAQKLVKGRVYLPALIGRNKHQYMADDDYQATFGASPNELAILNIYSAGTLDGPVSGTSLTITLEYTVELFDVKQLPAS